MHVHTCPYIWYECSSIYVCTHPLVLSFKRPRGQREAPCSSVSFRPSPKVCLAINTPLGTPVYHAPPHPSQALRMLVKMMNVHSAPVTRAILEQLHSNVIDVSSKLSSLALENEGKMHCLSHLSVPSLRIAWKPPRCSRPLGWKRSRNRGWRNSHLTCSRGKCTVNPFK